MSIYVGIIVLEELENKQRYDQTMKELSLFLKTHHAEIDLQIDDKYISFKPIDSLSEIHFPQNCTYFRTSYFRISTETPNDEIYLKRFCELVWECCCIFKENFPSRIELFQENLDQYINIDEVSLNQELLRRQINTILNKLSLQEKLKKDEIWDIFAILENSITLQNIKGLKACIEILESDLCAPCLLQQIGQKEIELLESIDSDDGVIKQNLESELLLKEYQDIRQSCQSILCKILRVKNQLQNDNNNPNNAAAAQSSIIQQLKKFEVINYNQPSFKHSYIFQLRETSDIERITFILDTLMSKNLKLMEDIQSLGLPQVIGNIIEKYSDGEFGIDFSEVTQYCVFHNRLLKYLNRTMETQYCDFLYTDERDGAFAYKLFQILEEGVLNILKNTVNLDHREKFEKDLYLSQIITLYETFLTSERAQHSQQFQFHFKNHLITVKDVSTSFLGIGAPEDLSSLSKELKNFYLTITKLSDRVEYAFTKKTNQFGGLQQQQQQLDQSTAQNQIYGQSQSNQMNGQNQINGQYSSSIYQSNALQSNSLHAQSYHHQRQTYQASKDDQQTKQQQQQIDSASKNWIQDKKNYHMKYNHNLDLPRQQNILDFSNSKSNLNKSNLSQQQDYVLQSAPQSDYKYSFDKKPSQVAQPKLKEQYARQQQTPSYLQQQQSQQSQLQSQQQQLSQQQQNYSQLQQQSNILSSYERNNIFSQNEDNTIGYRVQKQNPFLRKQYEQNNSQLENEQQQQEEDELVRTDSQHQ